LEQLRAGLEAILVFVSRRDGFRRSF
jgi:hypothetical protein